MKRIISAALIGIWLCACATTPEPAPPPVSETPDAPEQVETPIVEVPPTEVPEPEPVLPEPTTPEPVDPMPEVADPAATPARAEYLHLPYWSKADLGPAAKAMSRSCRHWRKVDPDKNLHADHLKFGQYKDWQSACEALLSADLNNTQAIRSVFEREFLPVSVAANSEGLLTGYYQPEIDARKYPNKEFREPILAVPTIKENRTKRRDQLSAASARVIAFGRPIDVFFMQIQGSGILVFPGGERLRAAYADNNGHAYTSIGRVLIDRGELTKTEASKQSIEAWMKRSGPVKARALMNENKRYIFFKEQTLTPGEGPLGAMRVPLTQMGSMAIDTRFYPYGLPIWVNTTLPQKSGDYNGNETGLLLITQDTGRAIRGEQRGDIYFGTGASAGALAGVMKHPGQFTLLLPRDLVLRQGPAS